MRTISEEVLQKMAAEAGGIRLDAAMLDSTFAGKGCGAPTYVEGTNGGKMPCGAILHRFGAAEPYYCGLCRDKIAK